MAKLNWKRVVKPTVLSALLAAVAVGASPACNKSSNNDNSPTITGGTMTNGVATGYAVAAGGQGQVITFTVQDPSNNNAIVQVPGTLSTTALWNTASVSVAGRFYQAQTLYNPATGRLLVLLGWAPTGSLTPIGTRGQMFQVNPAAATLTVINSSGAGTWTDVTQAIPSLGAP